MRQQHPDRDVADRAERVVHLGELGEVAGRVFVERQPATIAQLHHRDRGEGLGDGRPVEQGALVDPLTQGSVAEPILVVRLHPAVPHDEHAPPDHAVAGGELVEHADERRPACWRRGGALRRRWERREEGENGEESGFHEREHGR